MSGPVRGALAACLVLLSGCAAPGETVNEEALRRWTERKSERFVAPISSEVLAALNADREYRVGADDVLELAIYDLDRLGERSTLEVQVTRAGLIDVPLAGTIHVAGLTPGEVRDAIAAGLERFLARPQVTVKVQEFKSTRIAVLGAVAQPGVITLPVSEVTITEALALAGGPGPEAGMTATLFRAARRSGESFRIEVDLLALENGDVLQNFMVRSGDVIQVAAAPPIFVIGYVNKVGEIPLKRPMTLLEAVAIAGGVQIPEASPTLARIRRRTDGGSATVLGAGVDEEVIEVDLVAIADGEAPDVPLVAWDIVEVPQSTTRWVVLGVTNFVTRIVSFGYNLASLF